MVAPWDWSGLLFLRVLHELAYFTHVVESEDNQRVLLDKFVGELLKRNRRNLMQNRLPLPYRKAVRLTEDVVRSCNRQQDKLQNKASVYTSSRLAAKYKTEKDKAE